MKKPLILILLSATTFFASCSSENQEPEEFRALDCSVVLCLKRTFSLKVRFVDKATDEDLIFNADPVYSINDVKVIESFKRNDSAKIELDSVNNVVNIKFIEHDDLIQLGNLPSDKISIHMRALYNECCSPVQITKFSVGELLVCEPCEDLNDTIVVIKKSVDSKNLNEVNP